MHKNRLVMTKLLEIQRAIHRSLVAGDSESAAAHIVADGLAPGARLNIYRNTFIGGLTNALRLSFPAIHRLVGPAFFESAARMFIEAQPPRTAYLDEYGGAFPEFLEHFPPAATLPYLPPVATLEWAINRALHAADVKALDLSRLAIIDPADHGRITFTPHPSVRLVHAQYPVDVIWRAVLAQDDATLAGIDPDAGPVWLLVQRIASEIDVIRIDEPAWHFAFELCASHSLQTAIDNAPEVDTTVLLAEHLAAGRFVDFSFADQTLTANVSELPA